MSPEMKPPADDMLDSLFADARASVPEPSDALMARIVADAAAMQPDAVVERPAAPAPGFVANILAGLGGWPAIGGLVTSAAAGVYLGFVQPGLVGDTSLTANDSETEFSAIFDDFAYDDTLFLDEG